MRSDARLVRHRRRMVAVAAVVVVCVGQAVLGASPASATLTGPCTASWQFAKGTASSPPSKVFNATTGDVVEVAPNDSVSWQGAVSGVSGQRLVSGSVAVDLPWPFGTVTVKSWGNDGKKAEATENKGVEKYDLPSLIPRNVEFKVIGQHNDQGVSCAGSIRIRVAGSSFSSPVAPILLGLTGISLLLLVFAGRPKFTQVWIEHP